MTSSPDSTRRTMSIPWPRPAPGQQRSKKPARSSCGSGGLEKTRSSARCSSKNARSPAEKDSYSCRASCFRSAIGASLPPPDCERGSLGLLLEVLDHPTSAAASEEAERPADQDQYPVLEADQIEDVD